MCCKSENSAQPNYIRQPIGTHVYSHDQTYDLGREPGRKSPSASCRRYSLSPFCESIDIAMTKGLLKVPTCSEWTIFHPEKVYVFHLFFQIGLCIFPNRVLSTILGCFLTI